MLESEFETYLRIERGYSPLTIKAYMRDLSDLAEYLDSHHQLEVFSPEHVGEIHSKILRSWLGDLKKNGMSTRTISRKLSASKTYFGYLLRCEIITSHPASGLSTRGKDKKLPVFLKESETERLLDHIPFPNSFEGIRDQCILEVLYGCGLRRSEIISLQTDGIDILGGTLRVRGKGDKERIVPFGIHVRTAIIRYIAVLKLQEIDYRRTFFLRSNGEPLYPKLVYRIVNKYLTLASNAAQKSPHVLRHTFATHLLDRGADLNAIKELLGHSSLASTQVYTHNTISKLKDIHKQAHPRSQDDNS